MKKSFTLIELLIVIGILAILVVTILITLNPSEAQKKARDVKRMKDLATLEAIIVQYIADGNPPICTLGCTSEVLGPGDQPCAANWIRTTDNGGAFVDLCKYTNTIPVAPRNGQNVTFISKTGSFVYRDFYRLTMRGGDYKLGVFQESTSNINNVINDGGINDSYVERGSDMNLW